MPPANAIAMRAAARRLRRKRQRAASREMMNLPCAQKIISNLVRHAFRRPATDNDVELLRKFLSAGPRQGEGSFDAGIEMALRRILADPEFVFRFETPPANVKPGEAYRLGDLELASRLSFFLWSSIPDDQLLDTAIQGKLHEPAVLDREDPPDAQRPQCGRPGTAISQASGCSCAISRAPIRTRASFRISTTTCGSRSVRETEMLFESVLREDRIGAGSARRRLHVRERTARKALWHSGNLRSGLPPRDGSERCSPWPPGPGKHAAGDFGCQPHFTRPARQVDSRKYSGQSAAAASAERSSS